MCYLDVVPCDMAIGAVTTTWFAVVDACSDKLMYISVQIWQCCNCRGDNNSLPENFMFLLAHLRWYGKAMKEGGLNTLWDEKNGKLE